MTNRRENMTNGRKKTFNNTDNIVNLVIINIKTFYYE